MAIKKLLEKTEILKSIKVNKKIRNSSMLVDGYVNERVNLILLKCESANQHSGNVKCFLVMPLNLLALNVFVLSIWYLFIIIILSCEIETLKLLVQC